MVLLPRASSKASALLSIVNSTAMPSSGSSSRRLLTQNARSTESAGHSKRQQIKPRYNTSVIRLIASSTQATASASPPSASTRPPSASFSPPVSAPSSV